MKALMRFLYCGLVRVWGVLGCRVHVGCRVRRTSPHVIFAASFSDSELAAGSWSKVTAKVPRMTSRNRCNGDARWIGMGIAPESDTIFGLTAKGSVYACEGALPIFASYFFWPAPRAHMTPADTPHPQDTGC